MRECMPSLRTLIYSTVDSKRRWNLKLEIVNIIHRKHGEKSLTYQLHTAVAVKTGHRSSLQSWEDYREWFSSAVNAHRTCRQWSLKSSMERESRRRSICSPLSHSERPPRQSQDRKQCRILRKFTTHTYTTCAVTISIPQTTVTRLCHVHRTKDEWEQNILAE